MYFRLSFNIAFIDVFSDAVNFSKYIMVKEVVFYMYLHLYRHSSKISNHHTEVFFNVPTTNRTCRPLWETSSSALSAFNKLPPLRLFCGSGSYELSVAQFSLKSLLSKFPHFIRTHIRTDIHMVGTNEQEQCN